MLKGIDQPPRDLRDFIDRAIESRFVGLGWVREAAQLADELQRGGADFIRRSQAARS